LYILHNISCLLVRIYSHSLILILGMLLSRNINKKYNFCWLWIVITIGLGGMILSEIKKMYTPLQYTVKLV
jgi:membrane-bound metal-dependent hydrolase YbcI (DUF457 family)